MQLARACVCVCAPNMPCNSWLLACSACFCVKVFGDWLVSDSTPDGLTSLGSALESMWIEVRGVPGCHCPFSSTWSLFRLIRARMGQSSDWDCCTTFSWAFWRSFARMPSTFLRESMALKPGRYRCSLAFLLVFARPTLCRVCAVVGDRHGCPVH